MSAARVDAGLLNSYKVQTGQTLAELSAERPLLLIFLRHFGCTFCREAVAEISELRKSIEEKGTRIGFVHLADEERAQKFFTPYGLEDVPRIADPEGKLYDAFGLTRAHWGQYVNRESILRMLIAWLQGHWAGLPAGDVERMPGLFLLVNGEIRKAYRHKLVSDRPDYLALATFERFA